MAERECTTEAACRPNESCSLSNEKVLTLPTYTPRAKVITSTCNPDGPGLKAAGERCFLYTECASRACVPNLIGSFCSSACGEIKDCQGLPNGAYCRFVDVTLQTDAAVDYAPICVVPRPGTSSEVGNGEYGAECSKTSQCKEAGCVGATDTTKGHCTPACCDDSQCSKREDGQQIRCRPYAFGARYEMRCDI
jgi:hypothetical protein